MEQLKVTKEDVANATARSEQMGALPGSILKGKGNIAGFVGEEVIRRRFKMVWSPDYSCDLIAQNGERVDVKTKQCTSPPRLDYEASIRDRQKHQKCDYYVFCRVLKDLTILWYMGYMPKDEYFQRAVFLREGEVDPSNNFTVKADCWNLPYKELYI